MGGGAVPWMHLALDAHYCSFRFVRGTPATSTRPRIVLVAGAADPCRTWLVRQLHMSFATERRSVRRGRLRWMARTVPWVQHAMSEITLLGTGLVVVLMVAVAATFLWLTDHRFSALLLVIATWGGVAINALLKSSFDRPRPKVFEWGAQVLTSSFPSGHAMTATISYGTVAYLAARLQRRHLSRSITYPRV